MPKSAVNRAQSSAKKKNSIRSSGKAKAKLTRWDRVKIEQLNPLFGRQYLVGTNVMLARVFLKKGSLVPLHHHHNEQLSYVLEGTLVFNLDGRRVVVRSGEVLTIPPHMPHKVKALEDSVSLDIFDPPREDWINKTDDYLRHVR